MSSIYRIFIEKKSGFDLEAKNLLHDFQGFLQLSRVTNVRLFYRYDIEDIKEAVYTRARDTIFSDPVQDNVYEENLPEMNGVFLLAVSYLPGQFDQRADSAEQCIRILDNEHEPKVVSAKVIAVFGALTPDDIKKIEKYCINPVDSRKAELGKPRELRSSCAEPQSVAVVSGFTAAGKDGLIRFQRELSLVMTLEDLEFCRDYFKDREQRDPTVTELKMLDTYWSDHCRHTTFLTEIKSVEIEDARYAEPIKQAYRHYLESRRKVYGNSGRADCLMDLATICMKELHKSGKLPELEISDEINACTIRVNIGTPHGREDWLILFKNETHNHPTEIEPFGGAATCLGGAIRDPLSGRAYVYQAMRLTGSGDPRASLKNTLPGKLPQRTITTLAARGYSSYGNQIGLNTGLVREIYHPGYVAKRMEIGAVVGAVPAKQVRREKPAPGDYVVLIGGATGRDGIGGATGSSRAHDDKALENSAEVQKGNAPEERKLQRLFANPQFSRLVKKANDFGAGGVSVAVGELADGLEIDLDALPKKYNGLDGTELALSESQERMAVVIEAGDYDALRSLAEAENVEAVRIARVTPHRRLRMKWKGRLIVDIDREFLDSNGLRRESRVKIKAPDEKQDYFRADRHAGDIANPESWRELLHDLNVCSQRGLVEQFDNSIGALNVLNAWGGKYLGTPVEAMVSRLPFAESDTATAMSWGFDPFLSQWSPFHGGFYAVLDSVARLVAAGVDVDNIYFTFQEYFEKLGDSPEKWGKPYAALLGAYTAQMAFGRAAIGGKDSMSGSFKQLDVPPTLVSFALAPMPVSGVISNDLKGAGHLIVLVYGRRDEKSLVNPGESYAAYKAVNELSRMGKIYAAQAVGYGGYAAALVKMAFGNRVGFEVTHDGSGAFTPQYGALLLEIDEKMLSFLKDKQLSLKVIGKTLPVPQIRVGSMRLALEKLNQDFEEPLEEVFPTAYNAANDPEIELPGRYGQRKCRISVKKPKVIIPVFPGTNCEFDSAHAWERAGAEAEIFIFKNRTPQLLQQSLRELAGKIVSSQIIMIPGGFSAGDEPEGSGKFIAAVFRNPAVRDAVDILLQKNDGLILGVCNGFQALIRLGLLPYGRVLERLPEDAPTLTFNRLKRHHSGYVHTRIVSSLSPWTQLVNPDEDYIIPVSNGEGRFWATERTLSGLAEKGQIVSRYITPEGQFARDARYNPSGSVLAIEGICSPDGKIFGKMGHSERTGQYTAINVPGNHDQEIFKSGVHYFK